MSFYNTNHTTGVDLLEAREVNDTDEAIVLVFLNDRPYQSFTACEIWQSLRSLGKIGNLKPLTSIRRSLTDLSSENKVYKREAMKVGLYGKLVHTWQAKGEVKQGNFNF